MPGTTQGAWCHLFCPSASPRVKVNLCKCLFDFPRGEFLGTIHAPGWGWWAKLASILMSCISGNGLAEPPAPLPGRYLLGFQQMPTKAPGVFFQERVLPETKCFESPFSLKKVERVREMELPLLKRRGHPNVTPLLNPFSTHKQMGFCRVPSPLLPPGSTG